MNPWIVIVATACASNQLNVVNTVDIRPTSYRIPVAPAPSIAVYRAASRDEAEALAIGYRERKLADAAIGAPEPTRPWVGLGCSESSVVIAPDGRAYSVSRKQKTREVTRVVEEPDGTEVVWSERGLDILAIPQ